MTKQVTGGVALILAAFPICGWAQSASDVAAAAQGADVVILGEVHDNPAHHAMQADVVGRLDPSALVFEMLDPSEAALLTPELAADATALAAALDWENSGWPDFAFYFPLFQHAATRVAYGAEVSREAAQEAFITGAGDAFPGQAARFGLTEPLPADQQAAREAGQMAAHCDALPEDLLPGFVEAQRLRDAALAEAALRALEDHGAPVVVITGNGHARQDWGVPALLRVAAPDVTVFSLGQVEGDLPKDAPFDMVVTADPV
ncbi:MAG: ChaN family lipoprotein, partial [Pseudomonadota bacterium]